MAEEDLYADGWKLHMHFIYMYAEPYKMKNEWEIRLESL